LVYVVERRCVIALVFVLVPVPNDWTLSLSKKFQSSAVGFFVVAPHPVFMLVREKVIAGC
jgi:hypothetical protein